MNQDMQYSGAGFSLTEKFEGCKLTAYRDAAGVWTNGYGNTHGVVPGSTITQDQAVADLKDNIQTSVNDINRLVTVQLNQDEFDALVDFDFNLGSKQLASSTLLALLNAGKFNRAAAEFDKWDHGGGAVLAGLLRRREAETAAFSGTPPHAW